MKKSRTGKYHRFLAATFAIFVMTQIEWLMTDWYSDITTIILSFIHQMVFVSVSIISEESQLLPSPQRGSIPPSFLYPFADGGWVAKNSQCGFHILTVGTGTNLHNKTEYFSISSYINNLLNIGLYATYYSSTCRSYSKLSIGIEVYGAVWNSSSQFLHRKHLTWSVEHPTQTVYDRLT